MVMGNGLIAQALSGRGVSPLPLFGADLISAAVVPAQGFNPTQSRRSRRMKDLQHQLVRQK
jgi:hypothetical protein